MNEFLFPPLLSLYIDKLRNFNNLKLEFNPELNILVGPNGVGKTTILKIIRDYLTSEFGIIQLSNKYNASVFTIVGEFQDFLIDEKNAGLLNLDNGLMKYEIKVENDVVPTTVELSKMLISRYHRRNEVVIDKFTPASIKEIIGNNGRIISPMFKSGIDINDDPTGVGPGFLLVNNTLYITAGLSRKNLIEYYKGNKILFFNSGNDNVYGNEEYVQSYIHALEAKEAMKEEFNLFRSKASQKINSLFAAKDQGIRYISAPKMDIEFLNNEGKSIKELSSGEQQLERLKLFLKSKQELKPLLTLLDEPELHLNYGQLSYLSSILTGLRQLNTQVFIATHSTFFIRSTTKQFLVYLRFNSERIPLQVNLNSTPLLRSLLQHPDIIFAEKIIIVESSADAVFYERTVEVLLKNMELPSLSSRNIQFIPVNGKSNIKPLIEFINKYLGIETIIISDFDFCLDERTYSFITQGSITQLRKLLPMVIIQDKKKTFNNFKDQNPDKIEKLFNIVSNVIEGKDISSSDKEIISKFITEVQGYSYESNFIMNIQSNKVLKIFEREKIWILRNLKLENLAPDVVRQNQKVSVDKLNEIYFPETVEDLDLLLTNEAKKELIDITKYIDNLFTK